MYTSRRYWYNTWYPKVAYISDLSGCILWHVQRTRQYRVCVVHANSDSGRNRTYGTPLGWLWIAAQQYSSQTQNATGTAVYSNAMFNVCMYEVLSVVFVVLPGTYYFVVQKSSDHHIRLVLYSETKNAASFLLVSHVQQYYSSSPTTETVVCVMH